MCIVSVVRVEAVDYLYKQIDWKIDFVWFETFADGAKQKTPEFLFNLGGEINLGAAIEELDCGGLGHRISNCLRLSKEASS